eukprot:1372069-Amorphochlora_amoeboformis.AAC.1
MCPFIPNSLFLDHKTQQKPKETSAVPQNERRGNRVPNTFELEYIPRPTAEGLMEFPGLTSCERIAGRGKPGLSIMSRPRQRRRRQAGTPEWLLP